MNSIKTSDGRLFEFSDLMPAMILRAADPDRTGPYYQWAAPKVMHGVYMVYYQEKELDYIGRSLK